MWVRGLKHKGPCRARDEMVSHPMWVRGLKLKHIEYAACS